MEINFRTSTNYYSSEDNRRDVLESVDYVNGKSVFFLSKNSLIAELEKKNPYIKIVNIETIFPNLITIHCAEREEAFAFNYGEKYIVCDEDLKVLKMEDIINFEANDVVHIDNDFELVEGIEIGDFLDLNSFGDSNILNFLKNIMPVFKVNGRGNAEVKALFKKFSLLLEEQDILTGDYKLAFKMLDYNNFEINILDTTNNFTEKLGAFFAAYSSMDPSDYENKKLIVYEHSSGSIIARTVDKDVV